MRTFIVFSFAIIQLVSCARVPSQEKASVKQDNALGDRKDAMDRKKRAADSLSFQGCFGGEPNFLKSRTANDNINLDCAEFCRDNGFIISATRGSFCGCTNTLLSPQLARADSAEAAGAGSPCSTRCPGAWSTGSCRGDECCGGQSAYSVYVVGQIDVMKQVLRRVAENLRADNAKILKKEFGDTPYRYIKQDSTGKCFNHQGGSASPGDNTLVTIGDGCDEPRFWYHMLSDGSIQHVTSWKCFHPKGGSANPADNTELVLHTGCHEPRLTFEITPDGMIRHKTSKKCLMSTGSKIVFHSCESSNSKKFTFASTAPRSLTSVQHASSGKCWHPRGGSTQPGEDTDVVIHRGCGAPKCWFEMLSDGSIRHIPSGKCLHPLGGSPNPPDNTKLVLHSGCGEDRLRFRILSNGNIQHKTSGKCFHPYWGSADPADDTPVVLYSGCTDESRLKWNFLPLNIPALPDFIVRSVGETISSTGSKERKECMLGSSATTEKSFTCSATQRPSSLVMDVASMTSQLEHELPKSVTAMGKYDSELDNTNSALENVMSKGFSVSDETSDTFHTEGGFSLITTIGASLSVGCGKASTAVKKEISARGFFRSGYQHKVTNKKTETLNVEVKVPAGCKGLVNLFQETYPLEIKWRALVFAKGTLDISCAGLTKRFHVSEVLGYEQRKLYAFGTVKYGERDKIVAVVKIVDQNGEVVDTSDDLDPQ